MFSVGNTGEVFKNRSGGNHETKRYVICDVVYLIGDDMGRNDICEYGPRGLPVTKKSKWRMNGFKSRPDIMVL